jgi:hypothetical protein
LSESFSKDKHDTVGQAYKTLTAFNNRIKEPNIEFTSMKPGPVIFGLCILSQMLPCGAGEDGGLFALNFLLLCIGFLFLASLQSGNM